MKQQLFILLLFAFYSLSAQYLPIRYEENIGDKFNFKVEVIKDNKIFIYSNDNIASDNFQVKLLDEELNVLWSRIITHKNKTELIGILEDSNVIYVLSKDLRVKKKLSIILTKFLKSNGNFEKREITLNTLILPKFIDIKSDTLYISGHTIPSSRKLILNTLLKFTIIPLIANYDIIDNKPYSVAYNLTQNKSKELIYNNNIKQGTIIENDFRNDVIDFITNEKQRNGSIITRYKRRYLNNYKDDLNIILNQNSRMDNLKRLISIADIKHINDSVTVIAGIYGNNVNKIIPENEQVVGFFIANIEQDSLQYLKFYNFYELKTPFKILNTKDSTKVSKYINRQINKGNDPEIGTFFLFQDIIKDSETEIILLFEEFYPEYHTVNYTTFDYYGRPINSSYNVFDGYRYMNAFVCKLDINTGKILSDNGLEIGDILTYNKETQICYMKDDTNAVLLYSNEGQIVSKVINNKDNSTGKKYIKIASLLQDDKIVGDELSNIRHWHDAYFVAYGIQYINNKKNIGNKRKKVFYLNKIAFD